MRSPDGCPGCTWKLWETRQRITSASGWRNRFPHPRTFSLSGAAANPAGRYHERGGSSVSGETSSQLLPPVTAVTPYLASGCENHRAVGPSGGGVGGSVRSRAV